MKIGFFVQQNGPKSQVHFDVAKHLIKSSKSVMPDVPIVQFTDGTSPEIDGIDDIHRITMDVPMAIRRMAHQSQVEGDWLFVDTDVVFQRDVRDVFNEPFDIALTDRVGTFMEGTPYSKVMPYNLGVTFSRSTDFWITVIGYLGQQSKKMQEWEGDQQIICAMMREGNPYNVKVLPGVIYNYPPEYPFDFKNAAILHYKGNKKAWLLQPDPSTVEVE